MLDSIEEEAIQSSASPDLSLSDNLIYTLLVSLAPSLAAPPNVKLAFRINANSYIQHSAHLFLPVLLFHCLPVLQEDPPDKPS